MKWDYRSFNSYRCWRSWFAWYPIKMDDSRKGCYDVSEWVWLVRVERQLRCGWGGSYWKYRPLSSSDPS